MVFYSILWFPFQHLVYISFSSLYFIAFLPSMYSTPFTPGLCSTHSWSLFHSLLVSVPLTPGLCSTHSWSLFHSLLVSVPLTPGLCSTHSWSLFHSLLVSVPLTPGLCSTHSWSLFHSLLVSVPLTPGLCFTHSWSLFHSLLVSVPLTPGLCSTHSWSLFHSRFPGADWVFVATLHASNERGIQSFPLAAVDTSYAKYIKVNSIYYVLYIYRISSNRTLPRIKPGLV